MPQSVTVEIEARAFDKLAVLNGLDGQRVNVEITLQPNADSHGEAIIRALKQASDVAAARLGLLELISAPKEVEQLLEDMLGVCEPGSDAVADDALRELMRNWCRRLAAVHGLKLTCDA